MYWDIVEVAPKDAYSLLVRFKDGLQGIVHLHPEQLTGALEPLRDERFFKQVFVENGAVAWPGELLAAIEAGGFCLYDKRLIAENLCFVGFGDRPF